MPKTTRKRRTRRAEREIRRLLGDLEASGLSQRAFAETRRIPLSTLTWWRRKHGRVDGPSLGRKEPERPTLVPVVIPPTPAGAGSFGGPLADFEVELRSGHLIRVPPDFDAGGLQRLVSVLAQEC